MTGRHIACIIHEHIKISETDRTVLHISVELRTDYVHNVDTEWDETIIAVQKQPDDELLENLNFRQHEASDQLKRLVALNTRTGFENQNPRVTPN